MAITRYYKPELDLLRLFAFLFVFSVHRLDLAPVDSTQYYWGYHLSLIGNYGVPLFFFLSAFLITELLLKEQAAFGNISIRSFYVRRILRIWPLYFTFFFGMVLLTHTSGYFDKPIPPSAQFAFSLFSGNWYITFHKWQSYCINPLWSVSVEEQLYILLPLLIYFGGKRVLKIFSLTAIAVAYGTIVYYAMHPTKGFSGQWTNSFVQFQFFAAGILLSVYLNGKQPVMKGWRRIILFISGVACWLVASIACEVNADSPHLASLAQSVSGWLLILAGVTLMFLSLYGSSGRHLPSPLVYLGRISYGMYVFHITIYWIVLTIFDRQLIGLATAFGMADWKNELGVVIALSTTITLASLSYRFFERPFLRLKTRFTLIPSRD
jgi:peptidoglycan/LPS O-acetylase OafA/YrhL